jgi:hypothetical protein
MAEIKSSLIDDILPKIWIFISISGSLLFTIGLLLFINITDNYNTNSNIVIYCVGASGLFMIIICVLMMKYSRIIKDYIKVPSAVTVNLTVDVADNLIEGQNTNPINKI